MKIRFLNNLHSGAYRLLFRALAKYRPPQKQEMELSSNSRVLVFTCAGIGDTLTDSVVFKALAETFPGIHCAAVVHRRRKTLLEHNPFVQKTFTLEKGPLAFWSLHRKLKKAGPWDAILHLRGNDPEPRCQSFLLNPDVTVSVPKMTTMSWLCGHQVEQPDWDQTHGVEQTLRIARYVGADTKQPTLVYAVHPSEKTKLETKLFRLGIGADSPRLVLQIGGGRRASWRDWPVRNWADFIMLARQEISGQILLLGGQDNYARSEEIMSLLQPSPKARGATVINLTGDLSLTDSAALLASARVVVSTDTGIMHLGFAVGARVVAIIHCNNPASRVGPYGYDDWHRVVQLARPEKYLSPADADMANIRPEEVLENVKEIWKR